MKSLIAFLFLFFSLETHAVDMYGVYPSHWWVGMKNQNLQLILHGKDIGHFKTVTIIHAGVSVKKVSSPENINYLFIDLIVSSTARPGKFKILLSYKGMKEDITYELKSRNKSNGITRAKGVSAEDFIYLMIPDRFSNGDTTNDIIPDYRDQTSDRRNMFSRHGGDFKGIQDHLGYFSELGVTTLWLTPVIENDMPLVHEQRNDVAGYHGYWFTDHYNVDKRLGGNEGYKRFCDDLHSKGMKVIQDAVYNHVGNHHWFVLDSPMKDWFNQWPKFQGPNHREEVFFDPYASAYDRKLMLDGWFVPHLPDLNQRNPYVATFLIQHAIWTTEEFGIDGWRVDTYKYCDEQFLNNINVALEKEFPKVTVFGESWVNTITANAYFTRSNINAPFKHNAKGMLDFQNCFAMLAGMNEPFGWTNGVNKLYMTLSQDVLYKEPMNNCVFLDNHDMDRVFSVGGEDWKKLKMGLTWLLTIRGIPQIYYGTEVLMKNMKTHTDATVREDYPGGWPDDKASENRFTKAGRTALQNEVFDYVSKIAQFRKKSSAITKGKTMQFIPSDGVYTYFRYDDKQTVMVIANTSDKTVKPDLKIYSERLKGFTKAKDVITGSVFPLDQLQARPMESLVFELTK